MTATSAVHDRLATLADPTRGRILLALANHELTVGELCAVLSLPQSTVSRHLKVLTDEGWLSTRQEGTSRFYSRNKNLDSAAERLWSVIADDLKADRHQDRDVARLDEVLAQRRAKSREFFAGAATKWDELRQELFGTAVGGGALLGLLDDDWVVGDLGCGSGHLTALVAPFVQKVIGVDASADMLGQAKVRLGSATNVELRSGELERLPVTNNELDAAVLSLVLHHAPDPKRVLMEAHRGLRTGGRLLIIDLAPHDEIDYRDRLGHVWLGFSDPQVREWLEGAGFRKAKVISLPRDPGAKGPALFVGTAVK